MALNCRQHILSLTLSLATHGTPRKHGWRCTIPRGFFFLSFFFCALFSVAAHRQAGRLAGWQADRRWLFFWFRLFLLCVFLLCPVLVFLGFSFSKVRAVMEWDRSYLVAQARNEGMKERNEIPIYLSSRIFGCNGVLSVVRNLPNLGCCLLRLERRRGADWGLVMMVGRRETVHGLVWFGFSWFGLI